MRSQHADAPPLQCRAQRLRVADNLGHVHLPEGDHLGRSHGQRGDAVDLMRGGQHGEYGVGDRLSQRRVVPDDDAALRAAEGLARRAGHHRRALAQRVLELPSGHEADLVRAVEKELAAPFGQRLAHLAQGKGEQRHRRAQRHELRPNQRRGPAKQIEIDLQFHRIHGDVNDLQPAHACRAVGPVAGVAAERLSDAHDDVARLGQRGVDGQIADHARHQTMVGIAGAESLFQQFHAQRLDLVDVGRAGEPAVDAADVAFGRPCACFRRQQRPHGRAGRCFGGQQVDALLAAPALIAPDGGDDGLLHLAAVAAGVEDGPRVSQDGGVVDFDWFGRIFGHAPFPR